MVVSTAPHAIDKIQRCLEERIGPRRFQLWFKNSARLSFNEDQLRIEAPNSWVSGWIENNFTDHLKAATEEATGATPTLRFEVNSELAPPPGQAPSNGEHAGRTSGQGPASPAKNTAVRKLRYTLERFIRGPCNQLAYDAIQSIAEQGISSFNPLFLHGGCGLGKTHLLQGLCNALTKTHPQVGWQYVSGEEFTNQFIVAIKTGGLDRFRRQYRNVDVLVIDDVHFLASKRATQEEFLHTYNAIDAAGKQVVMASDAHPRMIGELNKSLVDRFISGMVVEIEPPDLETRVKIVELRTRKLGCRLARPIIDKLAQAIDGNVRELEGAVLKVLAYSSLCNQQVNMQIAEKVIHECRRPRSGSLRLSEIEQHVADYFGVKVADIRCSKRTRTVALARAVAMYLARKHTPMSFPEIGRAMGNKNHSTVILACKKIEQSLELNQEVAWESEGAARTQKLSDVTAELERAIGCSKA